MKKIYEFKADLENYDIGFEVKKECLIENSYFSKKEIQKYLEHHPVFQKKAKEYLEGKISFNFIEIEMRHRENISLQSLLPFIKLTSNIKKSEIIDVMYLSGFFRKTLLLSLKAKEYIEKRYGEKKIEFLEIFYEELPLYIMNVMENEYCTDIDFPKIKGKVVLDVSRIEKEIFRARASKHPDYIEIGIFCTEEFKEYLETSDLKGYQFIEVMDVAEALKLEQEKKEEIEPIFPEIDEKRYYDNGFLEWEGILWKGFRIKYWKFYYENGNLSMEGNHNQEGELTGEWKYYSPRGELIKREVFEKNELIEEE